MDTLLQEGGEVTKPTFLNHVFSSSEESMGELMNVVQYALMGVVPIVALNKTIHHFIPEADTQKSSFEILAEVLIQLSLLFIGLVLIHRMITYFPTYSGFKYENLTLTNVILAFLMIVLSIQTKLGIKVNILVDRVMEMINGPDEQEEMQQQKAKKSKHNASQADHLDDSRVQQGSFPPAPVAGTQAGNGMQPMQEPPQQRVQQQPEQVTMDYGINADPMAANSLLGGSFGASF
jgi:hypothetical protein